MLTLAALLRKIARTGKAAKEYLFTINPRTASPSWARDAPRLRRVAGARALNR